MLAEASYDGGGTTRKHGAQVAPSVVDAFAAFTAVGGSISLVTGLKGD
jgi:hypothetical protein